MTLMAIPNNRSAVNMTAGIFTGFLGTQAPEVISLLLNKGN